MYSNQQQLGDWKSFIKKTRDVVHKIFPRELSPTRMLEKYASDTKKKASAKLTKLQTESDARAAAGDAALASKIQTLEATALPSSVPQSIPSSTSVSPSAPANTPDTLLVAGLLGAGALVLYLVSRRKQ